MENLIILCSSSRSIVMVNGTSIGPYTYTKTGVRLTERATVARLETKLLLMFRFVSFSFSLLLLFIFTVYLGLMIVMYRFLL